MPGGIFLKPAEQPVMGDQVRFKPLTKYCLSVCLSFHGFSQGLARISYECFISGYGPPDFP